MTWNNFRLPDSLNLTLPLPPSYSDFKSCDEFGEGYDSYTSKKLDKICRVACIVGLAFLALDTFIIMIRERDVGWARREVYILTVTRLAAQFQVAYLLIRGLYYLLSLTPSASRIQCEKEVRKYGSYAKFVEQIEVDPPL